MASALCQFSSYKWACIADALILSGVHTQHCKCEFICSMESQNHPDGMVAWSLFAVEGTASHRDLGILKSGLGPHVSLQSSEALSLFDSELQVLWVFLEPH